MSEVWETHTFTKALKKEEIKNAINKVLKGELRIEAWADNLWLYPLSLSTDKRNQKDCPMLDIMFQIEKRSGIVAFIPLDKSKVIEVKSEEKMQLEAMKKLVVIMKEYISEKKIDKALSKEDNYKELLNILSDYMSTNNHIGAKRK